MSRLAYSVLNVIHSLNESPSEKEGKSECSKQERTGEETPSMKVPPKRKGNRRVELIVRQILCHPQ